MFVGYAYSSFVQFASSVVLKYKKQAIAEILRQTKVQVNVS